jgi:predicted ATPase/class 3 adenylate cyclase/DNA-binding CsgD family transcriptional regulator
MPNTPTGTITFLFTDVEGSTQLWERHTAWMGAAHARHEAILREAITAQGGWAYKQIGDAFQAAFQTAPAALAGAVLAQRALAAEPWGDPGPLRVRMALHTGAVGERRDDYVGPLLNRAARLLSAGHGGQILLSAATYELVRDNLPPGVELRDLGERRLKDLVRSERIWQPVVAGLPADFPPLRTLDTRPNNLPAQPNAFIGREEQVAAVIALLRRPDVRLLTLTGPGGAGKTRLGLHVAADLVDAFADGVFFVSLAAIRDPALAPAAIAVALGMRETGDQADMETLHGYLHGKQMLLLLDSFEHVAPAAAAVAAMLARAPDLKILVTSREGLQIYGEHEYAVPPLPLPDARNPPPLADLAEVGSVRLFVARAQAARADFVLTAANAPAVSEICRRLDGLPLAIELAAARTILLTPNAMRARLGSRLKLLTGGARDLPARQRTLRNTIAWSHDLLTPGEQILFRRLAVFAAGRTLESADAICDGAADLGADLLDAMESLLSKSLLYTVEGAGGERRYWMLETIHEYARERLDESGEADAIRARHAAYFLQLAETIEPRLTSAERVDWLERLEEEHDNLRAALAWSLAAPQRAETALRLGGALIWFWYFRGYLREGRAWLEQALAAAGDSAPPAVRARGLSASGALAYLQSDYPAARERLEAGLRLWRGLGQLRGIGYSLLFLSQVATRQGDRAARVLGEESLAAFREVGDTWGLALAHNFLAGVAHADGDPARGAALHAESLALFRSLGDSWGVSMELSNAGRAGWERGDFAAARADLEQALALQRAAGDKWNIAWTLRNLGDVLRYQGALTEATALLRESLALFQEVADQGGIAGVLYVLGAVAQQQEDYPQAGALFRASLTASGGSDPSHLVRCFLGLTTLAGAQGLVERAGLLCGAAEALFTAPGARWEALERDEYVRRLNAVRDRADRAVFRAARQRGRALTPAAALALALEDPTPRAPRPTAAPPEVPMRPERLAPLAPRASDPDALTPREVEVLQLVSMGLTDAEVAAQLVLSPRTVQVHLRSVYSKLDITSRSAATRYAIQHGLG